MLGTGTLDALIAKGYKYMFVSNSDNLGAAMDLKLLTWFAESGKPFAWCAQRTDADKKGGHLAQGSKGLLLRESAQCPDEDEKEFQNVGKHKYFAPTTVDQPECAQGDDGQEQRSAAAACDEEFEDRRPARQEEHQGIAHSICKRVSYSGTGDAKTAPSPAPSPTHTPAPTPGAAARDRHGRRHRVV